MIGIVPNSDFYTNLSGVGLVILVLGTLLAFVVASFVLRSYKRSVRRLMQASGGKDALRCANPSDCASRQASGGSLWGTLRARQGRYALAYFVSGGCCAAALTMALGVSVQLTGILFVASLFVANLWPLVLTVDGSGGLNNWRWYALYFALLGALSFVSGVRHGLIGALSVFTLFFRVNLLPTFLVKLFSMHRIRQVGPIVLPLCLAVAGGGWMILHVGDSNFSVAWLMGNLGDGSLAGILWGIFLVFLLAVVVAGGLGWMMVQLLVSLYRRRLVTDLTLRVDCVWMLFVMVQIVFSVLTTARTGVTESGWWALVAFPLYLVANFLAFRAARRESPLEAGRVSLLVLRAFALEKRAERVFEPVTMLWRALGPVCLIAGADFAGTTFQPQMVLQFASGHLQDSFIDVEAKLEAGLMAAGGPPDVDGRFRIHDFFCYRNTWRPSVSRLMAWNDVVLADFRGLGGGGLDGCVWEIGEMGRLRGLDRCVFLLEGAKDIEAFRLALLGDKGSGEVKLEDLRIVDEAKIKGQLTGPLMESLFSASEGVRAI